MLTDYLGLIGVFALVAYAMHLLPEEGVKLAGVVTGLVFAYLKGHSDGRRPKKKPKATSKEK